MTNVVHLRPAAIQMRLEQAFAAAEVAAHQSYEALRKSWPLDAQGCLSDASGMAFVYVKATRQLKRQWSSLAASSSTTDFAYSFEASACLISH